MSNIVYSLLLRVFGQSIAPLAREFGLGETLQLRDMKAVLYPVWRVDAVFDGDVAKTKGGREAKGWVAVREGYVPGMSKARLIAS
jgi:hypothetical protein